MTYKQAEPVFERMNNLGKEAAEGLIDAVYQAQRQTVQMLQAWLDTMDATQKEQRRIAAKLHHQALEAQRLLQEVVRSGTEAFTPVAPVERGATTERMSKELEAAPSEEATRADETAPHAQAVAKDSPAAQRPSEFTGRAELVNVVMSAANTDAEHAELALDAMLDGIKAALAQGEDVRLPGFGSFRVAQFQARRGRNPQTGEIMSIPERRRPVFRPGSRFREAIE
jgi:DNA-binding protein HU-beta